MNEWPLIGREWELSEFDAKIKNCNFRRLAIYGPAGVGKTRLAKEFLRRAKRAGLAGLQVTGNSTVSSIPLGAATQLIPEKIKTSNLAVEFSILASKFSKSRKRHAILIDDLHLIDSTSAVLMRQLVDSGAAKLISTIRSGEVASAAVEILTGGYDEWRIDVKEMNLEQAKELLHAALGGPTEVKSLHQIHSATAGNVLALKELVEISIKDGTLTQENGIWRLTRAPASGAGLVDLIRERLRKVNPQARPGLNLLALCSPLSIIDMQEAIDFETLLHLEESNIIQVNNIGRRTIVSLAHPLYGEVLLSEIPENRKRALLLRQAERVTAYGSRRHDDALFIASWRLAAIGTADSKLLVQASNVARHAHDYGRVISLLSALPEENQTAETLALLGDSFLEMGKVDLAVKAIKKSLDLACSEEERLKSAFTWIMTILWGKCQPEEALAINRELAKGVSDPSIKIAFQFNEGSLKGVSGDPFEGLKLLENLDLSVARLPDVSVFIHASMVKAICLAVTGQTHRSIEVSEHNYKIHCASDRDALVQSPAGEMITQVLAFYEAGLIDEARMCGRRSMELLKNSQDASGWVWLSYHMGNTEWRAGHVEDARGWYASAVTHGREHGMHSVMRLALSGLAACGATLGDISAAKNAACEARKYPFLGYLTGEDRLGESWLQVVQGNVTQAREILVEAAHSAQNAGHVTSEAFLLTDVARLGGAKDVVRRLAELAETCDGTFVLARSHLAYALAADNPEQLLQVSEEMKAIGADLLAAEAAAAASAAWRKVGQNRQAAAANQRAQACAARCQGARTPLLTTVEATAPLTTREREIALLAAKGTSSKHIAGILHLSIRTVDNHLQRTYAKLGVTTRSELATTLGQK